MKPRKVIVELELLTDAPLRLLGKKDYILFSLDTEDEYSMEVHQVSAKVVDPRR